jgi:DNA-binding response OmpR family regulator
MTLDEMQPVLVVEDEVLIQNVVEDALSEGGFKVVIAGTGEDAMRLFDGEQTKFCALVTDVNLGRDRLTGWDVARRAREIFADLPIVYMTGDSAAEWSSQGVPNSVLLVKPFAPIQIVTAIAQLLNMTPPSTD